MIDESRAWAVIDAGSEQLRHGVTPDAIQFSRMPSIRLYGLAMACAERSLPLLSFSTDILCDGRQSGTALEDAQASPGVANGQRQAQSEAEALRLHPRTLIVRTGPLFDGTMETSA